jgi:leader peptidase (prepilin peptidase)/N-methyltransferase
MSEITNEWIFYLFTGLLGLCVGSFITMASHRLPRDEEIVFTPSHCPNCNTKLRLLDLFPVLSWLWWHAKCRYCKTAISARYPLIELVTSISFVWMFSRFGFTWECLVMLLMVTCILILIITDFEHTIIPDEIQIALFLTVVAYHWLHATDIAWALQGLGAGLFTGLSMRFGYLWLRKKEGLGWGDVKLLPTIGLAVGAKPFILVLILSGLLGILTGIIWRALNKGPQFPFGPALIVSMFAIMLFSGELFVQPYFKEFFAN